MHMTITDDFSALGLSEQMLAAVRAKGFETPTAIQKLTIPHLLTKPNDIIAQSQTGTGKTAAYGLPILQTLEPARGPIQAIILVPTRELALQAAEELLSYNREKRLSITAIYGGAAMSEQLRRLAKGIDIVVGTPGRVLDHIRRGTMKLENVRYLVLDEADEMLNMGFVEDVEEIMSHTSDERRVLLFSATMPERIIRLSKTYMRDTEIVRVEHKQITADLTEQIYFEVREADKFDALTRIIDVEPEFYGIIFARTKIGADETASRLTARGYAAEVLHGDVSQAQREKILRKFRDRTINILVATDVAARGIDVTGIDYVINYDIPRIQAYILRGGLSADVSSLTAMLQYKLQIEQLDYQEQMAYYNSDNLGIGRYDESMSAIVMIPTLDENSEFYMSRTKTALDTMASDADGALAEATSHQDVITTTQYVVQQMQTMSDPAGLTTVNAMLQELETTMDQIQQALRVTDASYIIYKTQNYLVFNYAAGSFVQQIGLKRVIVEMAVFVVLCFGLCMVRTARQIRKEEQR